MTSNQRPKVFISYSWTSQNHIDRVASLVNRLRESGVETLFDKMDLKPGQDKYNFMEQSVTNPDVSHVLIICDKKYALKANTREGGVGDETQIISSKLYADVDQTKIIPILFEKGSDGSLYVPAYLESRISIDMSDEVNYEKGFDELLRHIYNKPFYRKSVIGEMPDYLNDEKIDYSELRRIVNLLRTTSSIENGRIGCYSKDFIARYTELICKEYILTNNNVADKTVIKMIDEMAILRNVCCSFIKVLIELNSSNISEIICDLFEKIWNAFMGLNINLRLTEHLRFHEWELLLITISLLDYYEKYDVIHAITNHYYLLSEQNCYGTEQKSVKPYTYFRPHLETLEEELNKDESGKRRFFSMAADLLSNRQKPFDLTTDAIAYADLLLYHISKYSTIHQNHSLWYPLMCPYCKTMGERLSDIISKSHCDKYLLLFDCADIDELKSRINEEDSKPGFHDLWRWHINITDHYSINMIGREL